MEFNELLFYGGDGLSGVDGAQVRIFPRSRSATSQSYACTDKNTRKTKTKKEQSIKISIKE